MRTLRSLRSRLFATTGVIVILTALIAWIASRELTRTELLLRGGPDLESPEATAIREAIGELSARHRESGDWSGAAQVLDALVEELDRPIAYRLSLPAGDPVLESAGIAESSPNEPPGPIEVSIAGDDGPIATLELLPIASLDAGKEPAATSMPATKEERLVLLEDDRVEPIGAGLRRWSVVAAVLLAGCALLLLGGVLFRLTRPLAELTRAAERLGDGELSTRAPVAGEDEVAALGRAMNAMAARIEEHERQRRELVNDVAHELRTPLTNLRARLESMLDGVASLDRRQVETLLGDTLQLGDLVDDLQVLALADAGRLDLELEPVPLAGEIEAVIEARTPPSVARGNDSPTPRIERDVPAELVVLADRRRLRQIVSNLLVNAIRHTPATGHIQLSATGRNGTVELAVADTGEGIPSEALERVFDRFYRVDASRGRDTGGTGLGLAIVRQLALAHGGEVRAESEPGAGSVFRVELPAARDDAP